MNEGPFKEATKLLVVLERTNAKIYGGGYSIYAISKLGLG